MVTALIPARGGSKRVPGKNILDMDGTPMIGWPIRAARQAQAFSRIIVTTDAPDIADVATAHGAEGHCDRPADISNDMATLDQVVRWAIPALDIRDEWVCVLYATAVLIRPETLRRAVEMAQDQAGGVDFVISLLAYGHPIQRAVRLTEGRVHMLEPRNAMTRTQDLEPTYHDAAQFALGRRSAWLDGGTAWSRPTKGVVLSPSEAVDIDTPEDVEEARARLALRRATPR